MEKRRPVSVSSAAEGATVMVRRLAAVMLCGGLLAAGCSTGDDSPVPPPRSLPPQSRSAAPAGQADWTTYHRDGLRSGYAPGTPALGTLRSAWTARLDGAVYGQPLVVRGKVVAATENDTVYALAPDTGRVLWRRHLGTPQPRSGLGCGNIDPLGITGTPVYDASTGLVFAVAETDGGRHRLVGLDLATGREKVDREMESPAGDRSAHQQRAALALLAGRVYIAYGGLYGDCGSYRGSVVSVAVTGSGPVTSYTLPTHRMGGIWAPGGPVVDGGRLLVSVGNGESTGGSYDGTDSVLALSAGLHRTDYFAPSDWGRDNAADADLGSLTPVRIGRFVLMVGKSGTAYLLAADHLGGIGGQLTQTDACPAYGAAAFTGSTVYVPCSDGLLQLTVRADGTMTTGWRTALRRAGSPVIGGGAVWVTDFEAGTLYALDPDTGRVRQHLAVGDLPNFASPVLSGDHVYLGTRTGVSALSGA
ncbi:PQQ-binding-like beta-propeller repeat protein [Streptomyces sp. NRRL S-646]|uniref:outer membrane protein assembly factor BamB family protein n=1 Tax=Streptomyces sp. NRRL S-646 TaxID=1463917 RepID=UPI000A547E35|nr:PQQ-binding-like beta-propeller repeat protein [Streptomyces sp. NRRL S-646]